VTVASAADTASRGADEPAPLLVPGRRDAAPDTTKSLAELAREKFRLGISLERQGMIAPAIAAYDVAIHFDPTLPDAHYRMGRLFLSREEVQEAVRHFIAELKIRPDHLPSERELGLGLARLGDSTRAIARLERLTRVHPLDDQSWSALGFAYSTTGHAAQAEDALRRAIALKPARAAEHRDLGVLLASRGQDREAREQYRKAIVLDPRDPTGWLNLGNLERRGARLTQALEAYRQAEARDSGFALAIQGQIGVLLQLDRGADAGDTYRRWLRVRPDDHHARLEAVRHFHERDRTDIALEVAREGVRRDPRSPDARIVLAIASQFAGQMQVALEELRTAQALYREPHGKAQVETMVGTLRAAAPDSLRALFAADSVAHAHADSATTARPTRSSRP
jgi:tetratricopeptide (TPR) repeat protein